MTSYIAVDSAFAGCAHHMTIFNELVQTCDSTFAVTFASKIK